ncbi:MAG: carbohydrate-binding domain-containing protein [Oscillospiraceae bacterium]|nr:carbohydrate-binding domain-containing protein [Oscillospiraceae bacterium]
MKRKIVLLVAVLLLLTGCGKTQSADNHEQVSGIVNDTDNAESSVENSESITAEIPSDIFSDRDFDVGYNEDESAVILLQDTTAECASDAAKIDGSTITIIDEGTYILRGNLDDGMIIVNAEKDDKTQLVLDGVVINSDTSAPLYILQADKVFVTLAPNSTNYLSNGGEFVSIDENNIDAAIFSKEDLTFNGEGHLEITSPAGHGVVSKDSLIITSGTYVISSSSHGLCGKDEICIANADVTINAGKDGIHAENNDDLSLGYIYIESGIYDITSEGDGISAATVIEINGGTYSIITGGGSVNGEKQSSENWGDFMQPGGRGGMGGGPMGGAPGDKPMGGTGGFSDVNSSDSNENSTSIKGIKASGDITFNGGTFVVDSADDAIHSNSCITVNGGEFTVATGDDAVHADDTLIFNSGKLDVSTSYEGLEALHIFVYDGEITLVTTDDGLNAAGGTDNSGFGGFRGNDMFGGNGGRVGSSEGSITIAGGILNITASGDGIDANGTLLISGGKTIVCGPTQGDTATLDYDISAEITGGTFIGTGSSMMAQTFSSASQGLISVSVGNQNGGTKIELTDSNGNIVLQHTPELSFAVVILTMPEIISGESYTLNVGTVTGNVTAE